MYDVAIIGAGIVGLAGAYKLLQQRPDLRVTVLDKEPHLAAHQTGHNSGVIHSGIYYRPRSSKARTCRSGYDQLLIFCKKQGIDHEICGKVIVAVTERERPALDKLYECGIGNGMRGLRKIGEHELREREPHVRGCEAIFIPQTGIVDYGRVARSLGELLGGLGADVRLGETLIGVQQQRDGLVLQTNRGEVATTVVVNCAGLYADRVAEMSGLTPGVRMVPFRGEYYVLKPDSEHLVRNLVYPVPDPTLPFLGVHFTRRIDGHIEAGPNAVLAFRREGYSRWDIHPRELLETLSYPGFRRLASRYWRTGLGEMHRSFSKGAFVKALQRLVPAITADALDLGGSGVRAQAVTEKGKLVDDFLILEGDHSIHVLNAPSPAATASLAIGDEVAQRALARLDHGRRPLSTAHPKP